MFWLVFQLGVILFPVGIFFVILATAAIRRRDNKKRAASASAAAAKPPTRPSSARETRKSSAARQNDNKDDEDTDDEDSAYELVDQTVVLKIRKKTKMQDQIVFTGSVINVGLTSYLMGQWPHNFWIWHTLNTIVLISIRWYVFRKDNQHYFLYDFCYWANYYSLIYVLLNPTNEVMFQVLFMVSNGPLAWSIPLFSSSTVFHNLQHMTSVFIHYSPMALTFCIRWAKSDRFVICSGEESNASRLCKDVSSFDMIYDALTRLYLWWMVLYYVWVFILLDKRVKRKGYMTLFSWLSGSKTIGELLKASSPHEKIQKAVYVLGHYCFALLTMIVATFLWHNFYLHLAFILAISTAAVWNGAGYYISVFSSRYEEEVTKKVKQTIEKDSRRSHSATPSRRGSKLTKKQMEEEAAAKALGLVQDVKRARQEFFANNKAEQVEKALQEHQELVRRRTTRRSSF
eukprot:TRINITY_DN11492_c0_g1_i1.p1 TRINITY_DN11492_c0_g1~~TRINITY_DN11492_c0_g1_i1.p1  ORF type:complete len:458 (+),score=86.79 TRINITY_DN11492_c0_g1_i1:76-1449(+)